MTYVTAAKFVTNEVLDSTYLETEFRLDVYVLIT
jgi:hypothetical protein